MAVEYQARKVSDRGVRSIEFSSVSMILRLDLELFQVFPFYWSFYYFTYVICDSSSGMDICSLRLKHRHHSVYFLKIARSNPCLALLRHIKLTRKDMDVNKRE